MMRLLAALALVLPAAAQAHDDAQWIQDGDYAGAGGVHCCSPSDCHRIYPAAVQWEESSVTVTMEVDGALADVQVAKVGVHPSKDIDYWLCANAAALRTGTGRCLFLPMTSQVATQPDMQVAACADRDAVLAELALKYQEVPRGRGITMNGVLLEITVAPDGKTWSALMTAANGLTCLVTAGEDWQFLKPEPAMTGRAM